MLTCLLILSISLSVVALLYARREYRKRGRLGPVGLPLLCAMVLVPNLLLEYATRYEWPVTPLDYLGVVIGVVGIALCLASITRFRSMAKVFCLDAGELTLGGPYRWSRNPQYLGYFAFLVGFALNDWSWWCLAALAVVAVSLHLLVQVEEEHLSRVFGAPYAEFCRRVPRYFGWRLRAQSKVPG
jgi:protein-S-isoprenylcysteine O-methyltransferase Ste14